VQDKNKYNSPKYRLVVRFTNSDIICQIAYATIQSDRILAAAYAHELKHHGIKVGFTNYAAAYATGLLLARRVLKKLSLDKVYVGKEKADGQPYLVKEVSGQSRPLYVLLDVGLNRTTTGSRVFAALKGAVDGGLDIPHNNKRLAGYNNENNKFDAAKLRKYIFAGNISDYMKLLKKDNPEKFNRQFSLYVKNAIEADQLEQIWAKAHASIRAKPEHIPEPQKEYKKPLKKKKRTLADRKNRVNQILAAQEKKAKQ
jgi:large subunit ribosomal protein L5e